MITRIDPAMPLISPKGSCVAHFLIDNGIETDLLWVTFLDRTGECWTWSNKDIRAQKNITTGRDYISPFYDPCDVSLKKTALDILNDRINENQELKNCYEKEKSKPHPWKVFLECRMKAMVWMRDEQGYDEKEIAETLSMTETQVSQILSYCDETGSFSINELRCKINPDTNECSYATHILHLKCNLCDHVEPVFCKDAKKWKCPCSQKL